MALATAAFLDSPRRVSSIQSSNAATSGAENSARAASLCSAVLPLISRSTSNISSIRRTASHASGEIGSGCLPLPDLRAFEAMAAKARALGKGIVALKVGAAEQAQARASRAQGWTWRGQEPRPRGRRPPAQLCGGEDASAANIPLYSPQ